MRTACVGSVGVGALGQPLRLLTASPTRPRFTDAGILPAVGETAAPAWRRDIDDAYKLFATKHVDSLTSRQIIEAAFGAVRSRAGSTVAMPVLSDIADVVAEDLARFRAATDELLAERPDPSTNELRNAAIEAMVQIRPDGHTRFWPVWADSPIRDIAEGRCEVRSEILPGGIGYVRWSGWVKTDKFDIVAELRTRVDALLRDGAKAWLFDVRGNHGGGGGAQAAAMFLDGDPVFRATFRDGRTEVTQPDRSLRLPAEYQLPIAIVVDSGTWSASEIFVFGLRQHGRATVIGERTAGFVGRIDAIELSDEARVGVNVALITGPNGEIYNGIGVKPDMEARSADAVDGASRYLREVVSV
ncbi:MAG: S41 family peptidase [Chloroflexota bacterium]|nr:S41 family peptidase [Chloroflexota bacterium]